MNWENPYPYADMEPVWLQGDTDLELDFNSFDWKQYERDEVSILNPQLEGLGYTVIKWRMGERDSFGPLSRFVELQKEGNTFFWCYN